MLNAIEMFNWLKSKPQEPKTLGQIGEEIAQGEYKKRGFKIIAKNEYNKKGKQLGEIDFIARQKDRLVFVEVKTRKEDKGFFGTAIESVDHFKQIKLLKAVKLYLIRNPKAAKFKPQIDVCVIIISDFDLLPQVEERPAKYEVLCAIDKIPHSATIIPNAVEDWN